jgi:hypothetical protein
LPDRVPMPTMKASGLANPTSLLAIGLMAIIL